MIDHKRSFGMEEQTSSKKHHFVLVHGLGNGAWCWYKLKTLLESAGHGVTALDMAASGINQTKLNEINTILEYSQPLIEFMASIPPKEKVVLVGHSFGGLNLAFVMDKFPQKISVAVFLAAFMPDSSHRPSFVLDQYFERIPKEELLDTEFSFEGVVENRKTTMLFGPECVSTKLYQLSPAEDISLATTLIRVGSLFQEDLSKTVKLSDEGYNSVSRVYIVAEEDKVIPKYFQHWIIENNPVKEVKEIKGSDHMSMISKPHELFQILSEIANTYI